MWKLRLMVMIGVRKEGNRKTCHKITGTRKGFRCLDSNIYNSLSKYSLRVITKLIIIKCRLTI